LCIIHSKIKIVTEDAWHDIVVLVIVLEECKIFVENMHCTKTPERETKFPTETVNQLIAI
jgi:hypothetical protein